MKIGVIPPLPVELFAASEHSTVHLWSRFYGEEDRLRWSAESIGEDTPAADSAWARSLIALCREEEVDTLVVPEPGLPKEIREAVEYLEGQRITVFPFRFPLIRNMSRLRKEIVNLGHFLGLTEAAVESCLQNWGQVRMAVKRLDGIQTRTASFSSRHYLNALAAAMDPVDGLENLKKKIEGMVLELESLGQDRWLRLGIIGTSPYRQGLFSFLEEANVVIVYDEWGIENNPMSAATDLAALYHLISIPYGLKRRQARLLNEIKGRRLHGILFCVESAGENLREEGFFRSSLPVPVHLFENPRGEDLEPGEITAIRRFLSQCRSNL